MKFLGIGDWGLGIGDWGLGPIPNPQSPIPIPNPQILVYKIINIKKYFYCLFKILIYLIFISII